jgi:hypothetical protein
MSIQTENQLREILDRHTICLHETQLARDATAAHHLDFMRQYLAHRNNVIAPTLNKLKDLVCEYGHDLLIEDAMGGEYVEASDTGSIGATLLLKGYDQTYRSACPQLAFSANRASQTISIYTSDRTPYNDGSSGQQAPETVGTLSAEKIEELFLKIVTRALAHATAG